MVECSFAIQTIKGTLCSYGNCPCFSESGWECPTMTNAVIEFEGLLSNVREMDWSVEFMEETVRKYGGEECES